MKLGDAIPDRWLASGLLLYTLGLAGWLLLSGVRVTLEDGFYYFKIAQHLAAGSGSTFDGVNPTNGYHPFWLLLLVPLYWFTASPITALSLGVFLQALLFGGTVICVYAIGRLHLTRYGASLAALMWILFTHQVALGGLEFSLQALGVLASAYFYFRRFIRAVPPFLDYFTLGLLLGLTILARLDTVLLAGIIGLWLVGREIKVGIQATGVRRVVLFSFPLLVVMAGYLLINQLMFGHPFPVSGVVKQSWSAYLLSQDPLFQAYGWAVAKIGHLLWPLRHLTLMFPFYLILGTLGVAILWLVEIVRLRPILWSKNGSLLRLYAPFITFSLVSYLSFFILYHDSVSLSAWYYVVQPWLAAILLATVIDNFFWLDYRQASWQRLGGYQVRLMLLGVIWFLIPAYTIWRVEQWRVADQFGYIPQPLYEGAAWVQTHLPADAVIGAWNAGALGYLSGRQVINLDGLVNSRQS